MMGNLKRITIFFIYHLKVPAMKRFNFLTFGSRMCFLGFKVISVRVSSTFCQVGLLQRLTSCKLRRRYSDVMCWEQARAVKKLCTYFCDVMTCLFVAVKVCCTLVLMFGQNDSQTIRPADNSVSGYLGQYLATRPVAQAQLYMRSG